MKVRQRNYHWWLWIGCVLIILPMMAGCSGTAKQSNQTTSSSTFDVSALKSTIDPGNSVQMTFDGYTENAAPIFDTQTKIMTIPVPIIFDSSDVPNLVVEKLRNNADNSLNIIKIDGFKPGETLFSPYDGVITINPGDANMDIFFLDITDYQKQGIAIMFATPDGVTPLINFNLPATATESVEIPVVKNQPIGNINGTSISMMGTAPLSKIFNLGVSGGKVILLTK